MFEHLCSSRVSRSVLFVSCVFVLASYSFGLLSSEKRQNGGNDESDCLRMCRLCPSLIMSSVGGVLHVQNAPSSSVFVLLQTCVSSTCWQDMVLHAVLCRRCSSVLSSLHSAFSTAFTAQPVPAPALNVGLHSGFQSKTGLLLVMLLWEFGSAHSWFVACASDSPPGAAGVKSPTCHGLQLVLIAPSATGLWGP